MSAGLSRFLQTLCPGIVGMAPPEAAREAVIAAGTLWFSLNARERRRIEDNIVDMLGPGERADSVKRQIAAQMAEHYFEKILVANRPLPFMRSFVRERVSVSGLASLDVALSAGHGAIAVTTHWGAVELIPVVLAERGYPLTVVMEARTPWLRRKLERLVAGQDVELLIASRGDRVLEGIFAALGRGRLLVTQADEVDAWRRRPSRTIRLFGQSLFFDHSIDFLAKRALSPAVALSCSRAAGLRYSLVCESLAPDPLAVNVALKALEHWERLTLAAPEQWYQWAKWLSMKVPTSAA